MDDGTPLAGRRREVLGTLAARGPTPLRDLAAAVGHKPQACAGHLRALAAAGLVGGVRDGRRAVVYEATAAGHAALEVPPPGPQPEGPRVAGGDYPSTEELARRLQRAVEARCVAAGVSAYTLFVDAGLTPNERTLLYRYKGGQTRAAWGPVIAFAHRLRLDPKILMPELFPPGTGAST